MGNERPGLISSQGAAAKNNTERRGGVVGRKKRLGSICIMTGFSFNPTFQKWAVGVEDV